MHRKEYLTAGLASVATIHAANSIYKSIDARKKRNKLVKKGEMSPEEARKLKNKGRLQEAAAVGIAALGIKGAVSEWKEMQEQREKYREFERKQAERHEKRLKRLEEHLASDHHRHSDSDIHHHSYNGGVRYDDGPRYIDGNPYQSMNALPPPPIGRHQSSFN
jgi:polyhydroxyalkanoate synthesis regulator phasin